MKELHQKLQIIKATIGGISKTKENPFFHSAYFDINELLSQLEPMFQEQGLLCLQPIVGRMVITEIIEIETGDKVQAMMEIPETITDPQKILGCVTYFRRGGLQSLLALQAIDDDGNTATGKTEDDKVSEWLTDSQFKATLSQDKDYIKKVLDAYNGKNGKGMKKDYRATLETALNSQT